VTPPAAALAYTVNSMSYDPAAPNVIFDWRNNGLGDACAGYLRIPVPDAQWTQWLHEATVLHPHHGYTKLPYFWRLAAAPYHLVPTAAMTAFVSNATTAGWNTTEPVRFVFAEFLCVYIGGALASTCAVPAAPPLVVLSTRLGIVDRMAVDLGAAFVDVNVRPLLAYSTV